MLPLYYLIALLIISCLPGCSSQQLYGAGQAWQRNECDKIGHLQERNRCMMNADTSYNEYQRQSDQTIGTK